MEYDLFSVYQLNQELRMRNRCDDESWRNTSMSDTVINLTVDEGRGKDCKLFGRRGVLIEWDIEEWPLIISAG